MSGTAFKSLSGLVLVSLLAACGTPVAWQKPGVTVAEAQVDSQQCAGLARNQAFRESFFGSPYGYGPGFYRYGPYGPPYGYGYGYRSSYDPFMWRSQREGDLQDFCLRSRGYQLAPIPQ